MNLKHVNVTEVGPRDGFQSEKTNGYSYNLGSAEGSFVPAMARRILNKHRRLFARGSIYGNMG